MKKSLLMIAALLMASLAAQAASPGYLSVTGAKQGQFKGEVLTPVHRDAILLRTYSSEVKSTRDPASGMVAGKRQYQPIVISKEIDTTSPQFFTALTTNEVLSSVTIELVKTEAHGGPPMESVYYTVKLTNANIAAIRQVTEESATGVPTGHVYEEISLTFDKIEVESAGGKTKAQDSWSVR